MFINKKLSYYTNRIVLMIGLFIVFYKIILATGILNIILPNAKSLDISIVGIAVGFILGTPAVQAMANNHNTTK